MAPPADSKEDTNIGQTSRLRSRGPISALVVIIGAAAVALGVLGFKVMSDDDKPVWLLCSPSFEAL